MTLWPLVGAGALMGIVGGVHCVVMCAAPCNALALGSAQPAAVQKVRWQRPWALAGVPWGKLLQFHLGRLLGYACLGALAAFSAEQLDWFASGSTWLRPVWVLMHLMIFAWGLLMLLQGQQPRWLELLGRAVWLRVQPMLAMRMGLLWMGMAWALLPCGLLYSAVLLAALGGRAEKGAMAMVAFGVGTGVWLCVATFAWHWLGGRLLRLRSQWGTKLAGAMLAALALVALWNEVLQDTARWCR